MKILRCELVVSELIVAQLIVAQLIVAQLIVAQLIVAQLIVTQLIVAQLIVAELIVTEIMGSELMTAAAYCVTSKSVCVGGVSRKAVSAPMPDVSQATVGSKPMNPTAMPATAPTVKSSKTTTAAAVKPRKPTAAAAVKPAETTAATPATTSGKCGDIRHGAKRAHRNACCQNAYRSLFHVTFPSRTSVFVPLTSP